jgi:hypothetical protein
MAKAKVAEKQVAERVERRRLNWKDVTTIIVAVTVLSGMLMSIVGWIHAEVTIPKILHQTAQQIKEAIKTHTEHPHPVSVPRREFDLLTADLKEDIGRVETAVKEFETEQKVRLDRIEEKIDRAP